MEPRFFHVHGIEASYLFNFRDPAVLFSSPATLYTSLISQPGTEVRELPPASHEMRGGGHRGMSASRGMGLERGKRSGLSFRQHEVEGLAPRGLRYSPDIERSKPSHHWNYQSLPLSLYSALPSSYPPLSIIPPLPLIPFIRLFFFFPRLFSPTTPPATLLLGEISSPVWGGLYYIAIALLRCSHFPLFLFFTHLDLRGWNDPWCN